MPSADYQFLTLNRERDKPEVGELREGEVVINLVDGRAWVGDEFSVPVELGKNSREGIISNALRSNYVEVTATEGGDFPIRLPDPSEILPGVYMELSILINYADTYDILVDPPVAYTDQIIKWDKLDQPQEDDLTPFESYGETNTQFIFKLYAFGPREYWFGKVIWADR